MAELKPRNVPCGACPYRRDCPSGVWSAEDYRKLPPYDNETAMQPPGVFMCHDERDSVTVCRGWLEAHDVDHLLALRLAGMQGNNPNALYDVKPCGVDCFSSGKEACDHGLAELESPGPDAQRAMRKIVAKHPETESGK